MCSPLFTYRVSYSWPLAPRDQKDCEGGYGCNFVGLYCGRGMEEGIKMRIIMGLFPIEESSYITGLTTCKLGNIFHPQLIGCYSESEN